MQATGRFAMGSNEPLGVPTDLGQLEGDVRSKTIDLGGNEADPSKPNEASNGVDNSKGSDEKDKEVRCGKRRKLCERRIPTDAWNDCSCCLCCRCAQGFSTQ